MGCKLPICSDHVKVMAHPKVGWVPCQGLGCKALLKPSGLVVLYKSNTFTFTFHSINVAFLLCGPFKLDIIQIVFIIILRLKTIYSPFNIFMTQCCLVTNMCAYVKIISMNGTTINIFWINLLSLTEIMVMPSLIAESFTQALDELDCDFIVISSFFIIWFMTGLGINLARY